MTSRPVPRTACCSPTGLLCILLVLGAMQVRFSHDGLRWFPEDDYIRIDAQVIDEALGGAVSVDVLIDSGEAGGLYEPDLLHRIERIAKEAPNITAPHRSTSRRRARSSTSCRRRTSR